MKLNSEGLQQMFGLAVTMDSSVNASVFLRLMSIRFTSEYVQHHSTKRQGIAIPVQEQF